MAGYVHVHLCHLLDVNAHTALTIHTLSNVISVSVLVKDTPNVILGNLQSLDYCFTI